MRRRSLLALSGTALTAALAGCNGLADADESDDPSTDAPDGTTPGTDEGTPPGTTEEPSPGTTPPDTTAELVNPSFEAGWHGWTVGRDLPEDPNAEGDRAVASALSLTTRDASDGVASLGAFIDGSQDDGTVWVQQPVDLSSYDYLAVDYRVTDSFNEILQPAVYAGPTVDGGLSEVDFDRSNSLSGHEATGWKTFVYEVDHDGPGIVAVGTSIVWETGARTRLDDVRLTAEEPTTVTPTPSTTAPNEPPTSGDDGDRI